jgi:hypothetical protein
MTPAAGSRWQQRLSNFERALELNGHAMHSMLTAMEPEHCLDRSLPLAKLRPSG